MSTSTSSTSPPLSRMIFADALTHMVRGHNGGLWIPQATLQKWYMKAQELEAERPAVLAKAAGFDNAEERGRRAQASYEAALAEVKRLQAHILERTKFNTQVLQERDAALPEILAVADALMRWDWNTDDPAELHAIAARLRAAVPPMDKAEGVCKTCGGTKIKSTLIFDCYFDVPCPDCTPEPRDEREVLGTFSKLPEKEGDDIPSAWDRDEREAEPVGWIAEDWPTASGLRKTCCTIYHERQCDDDLPVFLRPAGPSREVLAVALAARLRTAKSSPSAPAPTPPPAPSPAPHSAHTPSPSTTDAAAAPPPTGEPE